MNLGATASALGGVSLGVSQRGWGGVTSPPASYICRGYGLAIDGLMRLWIYNGITYFMFVSSSIDPWIMIAIYSIVLVGNKITFGTRLCFCCVNTLGVTLPLSGEWCLGGDSSFLLDLCHSSSLCSAETTLWGFHCSNIAKYKHKLGSFQSYS